ncbi:MAG: hypothetical protein IPJ88_02840 [Myxococcales bacterium]|nr:MAG: hypothetical protein IPJ88_02840 [Myxococcales bacterium]
MTFVSRTINGALVTVLIASLASCSAYNGSSATESSDDESMAAALIIEPIVETGAIIAGGMTVLGFAAVIAAGYGMVYLAGETAQYNQARLSALKGIVSEEFANWWQGGATIDGSWIEYSYQQAYEQGLVVSRDEYFVELASQAVPEIFSAMLDANSAMYTANSVDEESLKTFWLGLAELVGLIPSQATLPESLDELGLWFDQMLSAEAYRQSIIAVQLSDPYAEPRIAFTAEVKVQLFNQLIALAAQTILVAAIYGKPWEKASQGHTEKLNSLPQEYKSAGRKCAGDKACEAQASIVWAQKLIAAIRDYIRILENLANNIGAELAKELQELIDKMTIALNFYQCYLAALFKNLERVEAGRSSYPDIALHDAVRACDALYPIRD